MRYCSTKSFILTKRGIRMIAGLPGTGIGGIFYLFMALWMPVNEAINSIRGHANLANKYVVEKQLILTLCVIIAVIATSWLAGWLAVIILLGTHVVNNHGANSSVQQVENFLQIAPIILTSLTLLAVFFAMHGLRLAIRIQKSLHNLGK